MLTNDRRFALFDKDGRVINGKRTPAVHSIRAEFDLPKQMVALRGAASGETTEFSLVDDQAKIAIWLSDFLGQSCTFAENAAGGFPDDANSPGPTLISTATLETVAGWFAGLTLDEARRRFRANLEIGGVEPFWEDCLAGPPGTTIPFQIGDVHLEGVNPCQRCVVPTRASGSAQRRRCFKRRLRCGDKRRCRRGRIGSGLITSIAWPSIHGRRSAALGI